MIASSLGTNRKQNAFHAIYQPLNPSSKILLDSSYSACLCHGMITDRPATLQKG
jgi:hypothetical protein